MNPGADTAAGVLKCRPELTYHKRIGNKVEGKHQNPAENNLDAIKIHEAVQYITKAPYGRERHKGQGIPSHFF